MAATTAGCGVAQDQRPPRQHVIDEAVAVHVPQVGALAAVDEQRLPAHGPKGAHRRVDPAREKPAEPGCNTVLSSVRSISIGSCIRSCTRSTTRLTAVHRRFGQNAVAQIEDVARAPAGLLPGPARTRFSSSAGGANRAAGSRLPCTATSGPRICPAQIQRGGPIQPDHVSAGRLHQVQQRGACRCRNGWPGRRCLPGPGRWPANRAARTGGNRPGPARRPSCRRAARPARRLPPGPAR